MKKLFTFILFSVLSLAQTNTARMLSGTNPQAGPSYTFVAADATHITVFTSASAIAATMPAGGNSGFGAGTEFSMKNIGAGTVTVTCSSCTIASSGAGAATLTLATGQNADLYSDGANYTAFVSPTVSAGGGLAATPGIALPIRFSYAFARADASPVSTAGHGVACGSTAQNNSFTGSAIETSGRTLTSSAVASTSTVIDCGSAGGANPGQGFVTIGTSIRFTQRLITQVTTNFRYWLGVLDASGNEYTGGNSTWPSDAPNRNYCAFRFSSGTDTTWKAICATSNVAQTIVDTGVAPSTTASFVWEITFTPVLAPTQANFFINGTQVATISTNLPSTSANLSYGFMSDNKNTATAGSVVYLWSQYFEK